MCKDENEFFYCVKNWIIIDQIIKSNDWWVIWKVLQSTKDCPRNMTQKGILYACVFVSVCVSWSNIPVCQINIQ